MEKRATRKAEKRVCQICFNPVTPKEKCRSHNNDNGIKCKSRVCKTCMEKSLQVNPCCPFCRKELKPLKIKKEVESEAGSALETHILESFSRILAQENGAENALRYLEMIEREIENI